MKVILVEFPIVSKGRHGLVVVCRHAFAELRKRDGRFDHLVVISVVLRPKLVYEKKAEA
jgi:hypothetical protein